MAAGTPFHGEPLPASLGAVITGLRCAQLSDAALAAFYATWLDYALLIFPGQHLSKAEQVAFARRFGEREFDLAPISNVRADGSIRPVSLPVGAFLPSAIRRRKFGRPAERMRTCGLGR